MANRQRGWHFLVPLAILIYYLAIQQLSVPRGAFLATMSLVRLDLGRRLLHWQPLELGRVMQGIVGGARSGAVVALAVGAV